MLLPGQWLNGRIIDVLNHHVMMDLGFSERVYCFPCYALENQSPKRLNLPSNLWERDLFVLPVYRGDHWSVVFAFNPKALLDEKVSSSLNILRSFYLLCKGHCFIYHCNSGLGHSHAIDATCSFLSDLSYRTYGSRGWTFTDHHTHPLKNNFKRGNCGYIRQKNGTDCGVYVVKFVEQILLCLSTVPARWCGLEDLTPLSMRISPMEVVDFRASLFSAFSR